MTTTEKILKEFEGKIIEMTERIVIDYANFSGRGDNRAEFRNKVIKNLNQIRQEGYEIENKVRKEFKDKGFFNDGVEEGRQQVIEENIEHYSNFIIDERKIRKETLEECLKIINYSIDKTDAYNEINRLKNDKTK